MKMIKSKLQRSYSFLGNSACRIADKTLWVLETSLPWSLSNYQITIKSESDSAKNSIPVIKVTSNELNSEEVVKKQITNKSLEQEKNPKDEKIEQNNEVKEILMVEDESKCDETKPDLVNETLARSSKLPRISEVETKVIKTRQKTKHNIGSKQLVRPLPWIFFIPLFLVLKLSLNLINLVLIFFRQEQLQQDQIKSFVRYLRLKLKMVQYRHFSSFENSDGDKEQNENTELPTYMDIDEYYSEEDSDYQPSESETESNEDEESEVSENEMENSNCTIDKEELNEIMEDFKQTSVNEIKMEDVPGNPQEIEINSESNEISKSEGIKDSDNVENESSEINVHKIQPAKIDTQNTKNL